MNLNHITDSEVRERAKYDGKAFTIVCNSCKGKNGIVRMVNEPYPSCACSNEQDAYIVCPDCGVVVHQE
jgi:hypothetical protein